jgi:flagellar P-ring protein precursor FlgI
MWFSRIMLSVGLTICLTAFARAELTIGDVCRLKGQERNTLHGLGIVVGLNGTGDDSLSLTTKNLARAMQLMGAPLHNAIDGSLPLADLEQHKNAAMVWVRAEVPPQGARQGDELDCTVSAINAKSLEGGTLMLTSLIGPQPAARPNMARVYAFAQGPVTIEALETPTSGRVVSGCRLEESIQNGFVKDGKITLVINKNHANFAMASDIAEVINDLPDFTQTASGETVIAARAIDQVSVEVRIPECYASEPVYCAMLILRERLHYLPDQSRVVINEKTGVITVGADVEIAATAVSHRNMTIEVGNGMLASQFVGVDSEADTSVEKLKALVDVLNSLNVSAEDMIAIIRTLDAQGAIYGEVVYQ